MSMGMTAGDVGIESFEAMNETALDEFVERPVHLCRRDRRYQYSMIGRKMADRVGFEPTIPAMGILP